MGIDAPAVMGGVTPRRILGVLPIGYGDDWGFWPRDIGLLVLTLRALGHDAWLVALKAPGQTPAPDKPVICATLEELGDPTWWRAQKPDAVVLNTWSAPRYDPIRRAVLSVTRRVVERLDTDGVRSPRLHPEAYFLHAWGQFDQKMPAAATWFAAAAKTGLLWLFPALMDERMVASMNKIPALIAESPIAAERIGAMIRKYSRHDPRIEMIPHPVNDEVLHYNGAAKENRIIAVGRWATVQKDFPMLQRVLQKFLAQHRDWQATIVGGGVPPGAPAQIAEEGRVTYHEKLDHEKLAAEYSRAKIYLMVSRYESFCIAAAEALCCGCSVVGSSAVPTSYYFSGLDSGTVAPMRTVPAFLGALEQEVKCWDKGQRDVAAISSGWRARAGAHAVAQNVVALLRSLS